MQAEEGAGVEIRDVVLFGEVARCPVSGGGEGGLGVVGVGEGEEGKDEEEGYGGDEVGEHG